MTNFTVTGDWTSQGAVTGTVWFAPEPSTLGPIVYASITNSVLSSTTLPVISGAYLVSFAGVTLNGLSANIDSFTFTSPTGAATLSLNGISSTAAQAFYSPVSQVPGSGTSGPVISYVPWAAGVPGVLPATTRQPLTTQGGNTLDDGNGNALIVGAVQNGLTVGGAVVLAQVNPPTLMAGYGQVYVANDGSLHYLSPAAVDTRLISTVVEYTTTQTAVTVPTGVTGVWIDCLIGPGGGGGSGRRGAAATVRCGGGGGGAGGVVLSYFIPAARFGSTFTLTLPAGGIGGAAVTTDNTNGNNGGLPASASFASGSFLLQTFAGGASGGGTNATGVGGVQSTAQWSGTAGAAASVTGGVGGTGANTVNGSVTGGGAGGGITAADVASNGGSGGWQELNNPSATIGTGGIVGGALPGSGPVAILGVPGGGAGGGAASITGAAQNGANANGYGAPGGGGGASLNGNNSGAGGNGASAYCRLRWLYN